MYFSLKTHIFLILSFFAGLILPLDATTYLKMKIYPLNRLTIYFDKIPSDFNSFLNSDKTLISIIVNDATTKIKTDSVLSDGIIKKAELRTFSSHLEFNLYLKSPRGFSIVPLEFSQSLMIEVFDWNSLSPEEDSYRMGQLSLTNNLAVARNYFEKSFKQNVANAGYFLGYLYLKANLPEDAKNVLLEALSLGCNIPDVYAGIAQAYYLLENKSEYQKFRAQFLSLQDINNFHFIQIEPELKDSILKNVQDIFSEDEEKNEQAKEISKDSTKSTEPTVINQIKAETTSDDQLLIQKIIVFLLVSILLVTILLFSLYLKWKKEKKLLQIKKKFEEDLLNEKKKTIPSQLAAKLYKKAEEISKETSKTENIEQTKEPPAKFNKNIKEFVEQIIDSKKSEQELAERTNQKSIPKKYPPRVELAMQIQKEQLELIKKKFEQMETTTIPTDAEKLKELARNLRINKASLLAKKNIEAIEKNKDLHKSFFEKFFPKKKD